MEFVPGSKLQLRILHLEDSRHDHELVVEFIQNSGIQLACDLVDNETDFISALQKIEYDLILADFKLPGFDAFGALTKAKEIRPEVPFIVLSGSIGEELAIELIKQGAVDYVLKDKPRRLPLAIKRALQEVKDKNNRLQAEETLRKTEAFIRRILSNAPVSIFSLNKSGLLTFAEGKGLNKIGLKPVDSIGVSISELFSGASFVCADGSAKTAIEVFEVAIKGDTLTTITSFKEAYFDAFAGPILNTSGKITGVVIVATDITDKMKAELELRATQEQYQYLFDSSLDAILLASPSGEIFRANPSASKIFETSAEEICKGGRNAIVDRNDPRLKQALEIRDKEGFFNGEINMLRADGSKFLAEISSAKFTDREGNERVSIIIRDITARKLFEKQLIEAKEKAEENDRLKTSFLHNISHEIRTPLNGILGFASLLKEPYVKEESKDNYLDLMMRSGERMLNLINDLIDISQIETDQLKIVKKQVNLPLMLKNIFGKYRLEAENKSLRLDLALKLEEQDYYFETDEPRLSQVFGYLIRNSIKFTDHGRIEFGFTIKGNQLEFYVKDTGRGINPDIKESIFDRFVQEDTRLSRDHEGAGLGLSIARKLVEALGGRIWYHSEPDEGTIFFFTHPSKQVQGVRPASLNSVNEKAKPQRNKQKILIVEDDLMNARYLEEILKINNLSYLLSNNGNDAIYKVMNNPDISLVLMDIKLPGMSGFKATEEIKRFRPELTVIAQTAYAQDMYKNLALESGCSDIITKPIMIDKLVDLLRKYLF